MAQVFVHDDPEVLVADRIFQRRRELGLSRAQVCYRAKAAFDTRALARWENGDFRPGYKNLTALAVALEVQEQWLLVGTGSKQRQGRPRTWR